MSELTKVEVVQQITDLKKELDVVLDKIAVLADKYNIDVSLSGKHFYSSLSRYAEPVVVGQNEFGEDIDAEGNEVWESSTAGLWASSSDRC
jgi:hypothetical protein